MNAIRRAVLDGHGSRRAWRGRLAAPALACSPPFERPTIAAMGRARSSWSARPATRPRRPPVPCRAGVQRRHHDDADRHRVQGGRADRRLQLSSQRRDAPDHRPVSRAGRTAVRRPLDAAGEPGQRGRPPLRRRGGVLFGDGTSRSRSRRRLPSSRRTRCHRSGSSSPSRVAGAAGIVVLVVARRRSRRPDRLIPAQAPSSARLRSAIRSSRLRCRPTAGRAPGRLRAASPATDRWVITAGTSMSDSTPPSDSASVNSRVPRRSRRPAPPAVRPSAARRRQERDHPAGSPGSSTTGRARSAAIAQERGHGRARSRRGAPSADGASAARAGRGSSRAARGRRPSRSAGTAAARRPRRRSSPRRPRIVSEWPARYFVAEWNTMSAPSVERPLEGGRRERVVDDDERPRSAALRRATRDGLAATRRCRRPSVAGSTASRTRRAASAPSAAPTARPGPRRGRRSFASTPCGRDGPARGTGTCRRTRRRRRRSRRRRPRAGRSPPSPPSPTRTRCRVAPPSSAATARSSRSRVGFWRRAYS